MNQSNNYNTQQMKVKVYESPKREYETRTGIYESNKRAYTSIANRCKSIEKATYNKKETSQYIFPEESHTTLKIFLDSYEEDNYWNSWVDIMSSIHDDIDTFKKIINFFKDIVETDLVDKLLKAVEVSNTYNEEANISLIKLLRYWPEIKNKPEIHFYIKDSYWGITYKQTNKRKGTFNLYVKESGEIIYSYARRAHKGINRFTGKSYISNDLRDSKDIKTLFNMIW